MSKIENDCQIDDVIDFVYHAKDVDIQEIITAVTDRFESRFRDYEVMFLSLHKDPDKRKEDVERIVEMFRKQP